MVDVGVEGIWRRGWLGGGHVSAMLLPFQPELARFQVHFLNFSFLSLTIIYVILETERTFLISWSVLVSIGPRRGQLQVKVSYHRPASLAALRQSCRIS